MVALLPTTSIAMTTLDHFCPHPTPKPFVVNRKVIGRWEAADKIPEVVANSLDDHNALRLLNVSSREKSASQPLNALWKKFRTVEDYEQGMLENRFTSTPAR